MDLGEWLGITGVVTTLAVGLPVYLMKRDDLPTSIASGARSTAVSQQVNIWQRQSSTTYIYAAPNPTTADPKDTVIAYGVGLLVATAAYWAARPYLLVALGAIYVWTVAVTIAQQRSLQFIEDKVQPILMGVAFIFIGLDLVVLTYPGLVWGNGLQLNWSFAQATDLHGLNFAVSSLVVLVAAVAALLALFMRCLTNLVATWAARWAHLKRGVVPQWLLGQLQSLEWRFDPFWSAIVLALVGVVIALAAPHVGGGHLPTHS